LQQYLKATVYTVYTFMHLYSMPRVSDFAPALAAQHLREGPISGLQSLGAMKFTPRCGPTRPTRPTPNDKTAYTSLLWGAKPHYMIEWLISGCSLMHHCCKKRILFADDELLKSGFAPLLKLFWDVRRFEHLDVGPHNACTQKRLKNVWSKMLPWDLLAKDIEVAFMLDTDILVRGNCDAIFQQMSNCECKGVFRGVGEFDLIDEGSATQEHKVCRKR
jgi:hypothetical protein